MDKIECHGLDNETQVFFYEQDFYVLSNFSSFAILFGGRHFPTAEHLYHWLKFATSEGRESTLQLNIRTATSAHAAFRLAQDHKDQRRAGWDDEKVEAMRIILRCKVLQHEYVMRKLMATGDRQLIENSWRDDYWGWGENRDGQNMLGKLWMEVREDIQNGVHL